MYIYWSVHIHEITHPPHAHTLIPIHTVELPAIVSTSESAGFAEVCVTLTSVPISTVTVTLQTVSNTGSADG